MISRLRTSGLIAAIASLMVPLLSGCASTGAGPTTTTAAPTTAAGATTSTAPAISPGTTTKAAGATTTLAPSPTTTPAPVSTTAVSESTTTPNGDIAHPSSGIEFRSPSGNIHCEIDDGPPLPNKAVFCFTAEPPQSATLTDAGTFTTCTGIQCLANPGEGEIELPYGQEINLGVFRCVSSTSGMTCTANGKGFEISRSGVVAA